MNIAGFSLSNWMTYGFSFTHGSIAWRFPIAFQLVFSVVLLSTVPWLPESPRWLLAHGYTEQGVCVLAALEGSHVTPKDNIIVNQRDAILEAVRIEQETAPTWRDIIKGNTGDTGMIQRLILGAGNEQFIGHLSCIEPRDIIRDSVDAAVGRHQCYKLLVRITS